MAEKISFHEYNTIPINLDEMKHEGSQMMDSTESNKVDVVIGGEITTLKSNEKPEYLQKLALYVDHKTTEILSKNSSASINEKMRTLLIALNIADDYFKIKDKYDKLFVLHERFVNEMTRLQQDNTALTQKVNKLENQLEQDLPNDDIPVDNNIISLPSRQ